MSEAVQTPGKELPRDHLGLRFHPCVPLPSAADWEQAMRTPAGEALLADFLNRRAKLLQLMAADPLHYGAELDHWADADRLRAEMILVLIILGGNRSAKSEYCAKRSVQGAVRYPGTNLLCLAEDMDTSRETQQALIWKYLPNEVKALNRKQDPAGVYKINFSEANGFTEGLLVLPNHSRIHFKSYRQEPGECEGWEFGSRDALTIGGWADESLRLPWLRMMLRRFEYRPAQLLWSYTPVHGMTPTIKEAVGESAQTLESRPAELLPNRVHVPGCPAGHMPYIQEPMLPRAKVIYFFANQNPFGVMARTKEGAEVYRPYYEGVKANCAGRPSDYVMRIAYGYTTDTSGKAFPNFCSVNIVKREHLPAEGTNWHLMDPATARNWAMLWVRVTPGKDPDYYIYRDWPDARRFGEWAVPTEREVNDNNRRGWDGDPGPAQKRVLGYGVVEYKRVIEECESFSARSVLQDPKADPYRKRLAEEWRQSNGTEDGTDDLLREEIGATCRLVDPRAGADPKIQAVGGSTIVDMFAETQTDKRGNLGPLYLTPASGVEKDRGHTAINDLLRFEPTEPVAPILNCPRLFVSEDCAQVRWALENYTGMGGETGACKDFVDLVRYLAVSDVRHIEAGGKVSTRRGGAY